MKKIFNAVIKKLIKEERMLMVVEDSNDLGKKMLEIHPNYVDNWIPLTLCKHSNETWYLLHGPFYIIRSIIILEKFINTTKIKSWLTSKQMLAFLMQNANFVPVIMTNRMAKSIERKHP